MQTATKPKIQDISEFSKLFKINVPVESEFDYYINTLKKSEEYKDVDNLVSDFIDLEEYIQNTGHKSVFNYKMQCLDKVKDYIISTPAYERLQRWEFGSEQLYSKNNLKINEGELLISIDFKNANFNALKTFDGENSLTENWSSLCEKLGVHKILASSKSFRQMTIGNTNPKRLQKVQHIEILRLLDKFKEKGCYEDDIVFLSHDELVIKSRNSIPFESANIISELIASFLMPTNHTIFRLEKIEKDIFVKHISKSSKVIGMYKTLVGCPGNQFYMYFKKHVLNEQFLDDRDLYFINDNKLAKWVI